MSGEPSSVHPTIKGLSGPGKELDGSKLRVGIVHARWNEVIISALLEGAKKALAECKVAPENITILEVPGAYELPYAASRLVAGQCRLQPPPHPHQEMDADLSPLQSPEYDAVICIGCLIKGETMHFEYICQAVTQGIMDLNVHSGTPVIFGVLTVLTEEQAKKRSGLGDHSHNHGDDWGRTAVEMALLRAHTEKKVASKKRK